METEPETQKYPAKVCPKCNKEFIPRRKDKVFCTNQCKAQFNSKNRYDKLKNQIGFKKEAKKRFYGWLALHRTEFNAKMKEYMRKKIRDPNYLEKQKEYYNTHREEKNARAKERRRKIKEAKSNGNQDNKQ